MGPAHRMGVACDGGLVYHITALLANFAMHGGTTGMLSLRDKPHLWRGPRLAGTSPAHNTGPRHTRPHHADLEKISLVTARPPCVRSPACPASQPIELGLLARHARLPHCMGKLSPTPRDQPTLAYSSGLVPWPGHTGLPCHFGPPTMPLQAQPLSRTRPAMVHGLGPPKQTRPCPGHSGPARDLGPAEGCRTSVARSTGHACNS